MGEVKLQRVMLPHLCPLTKTRTNIKALRFLSLFFSYLYENFIHMLHIC